MRYIVLDSNNDANNGISETLQDALDIISEQLSDDGDDWNASRMTIFEIGAEVKFKVNPATVVLVSDVAEPIAETPSISEAGAADFELLDLLTRRGTDREPFPLKDEEFVLSQDTPNDYSSDSTKPIIPAGSTVRIDFSGDFGLYGFVNIGGVIQKIKIDLKHLVKRDFNVFL